MPLRHSYRAVLESHYRVPGTSRYTSAAVSIVKLSVIRLHAYSVTSLVSMHFQVTAYWAGLSGLNTLAAADPPIIPKSCILRDMRQMDAGSKAAHLPTLGKAAKSSPASNL